MDKIVRDIRFYGFATFLSLVLTVQSFRYDYASSQLPRFLSLCMLVLSFLACVGLIRRRRHSNTAPTDTEGRVQTALSKVPLIVFCMTGAYIAAIMYLGYFSASVLFFFGSMAYFGQRRPWVMALASALFLGVAYLLFVHFLGLRLPQGLLW